MKNSSCTDRTQRAEIYRKAAARVDAETHGVFSCSIIRNVGGSYEHATEYAALFKPSVESDDACWGFKWGGGLNDWQTRNTCRVIALCLMAAMVEAGDA